MTPKLKRSAVKVRRLEQTAKGEYSEGWFYENARSIDMYVRVGNRTHSCRIPRAPIADWIKRTEPKP